MTYSYTEKKRIRKSFAKRAEAAGGKLTMTVIALKIVASAIKQFPQFAASIGTPGTAERGPRSGQPPLCQTCMRHQGRMRSLSRSRARQDH